MKTDQEIESALRMHLDGHDMNYGPVTEREIADGERELGIRFPRSYRIYLMIFGLTKFKYDLTINGLPDERNGNPAGPPLYINVLDETPFGRRLFSEVLPNPEAIVFFATNELGGDFFGFDLSKSGADGEAPVFLIDSNYDLQHYAGSFLDFLAKARAAEIKSLAWRDKQEAKRAAEVASKAPAGAGSRAADALTVDWVRIDPVDPPPDLPVFARYFGVDGKRRRVFVFANQTGLDVAEQMEAFASGDGFFADPTGTGGGTREPFISIDYLVAHHPELPGAWALPQLKKRVLDAHNRG